ncbi:MAG TPA: hypothetical protein VF608_06655 [Thermoanaerobaculia bacterium]
MSMTTSHENVVVLISSDISRVTYVNDSFHITSGQPFTVPPTITEQQDDETFTITLSCGRSASSNIADMFNSAVGSPNHSWCGPYTSLPSPVSTIQPAELNFYFAVDVTFTGVSSPVRVYLGQGSQLHLTNNWWIGGPAILNTYPSYSLMSFFFVTTQKIYLVRCPENESGSKTLMNTFRLIPST